MLRRFAVFVALALLAACDGGTGQLLTVVASSPGSVAVGAEQRVLLVVAAPDGELEGGPDRPATVQFTSETAVLDPVEAEWIWAIPEVRGFYVAHAAFPAAGIWEARLSFADREAEPGAFQVTAESVVPEVGTEAPASDSATSADAPIGEISTDPDPNPAFYELSVAEAVGNGRPAVVVFATPAFCQTAVCGPMLETVEGIAPDHPSTDFVHVEIYEDIDNPQGPQREVEAVREWGLQTEPWVFVTDRDGIVAARFEGAMGVTELEQALASVGG